MSERRDTKRNRYFSIDRRLERADRQLFWRYFVSRTLKLSLHLLCENVDMPVGIIWPLEKRRIADTIRHPANLPEVGLSLISWLRADGASHTFLAPAPSFEYVNDYRVIPFGIETKDDIAIIVPRQVEALHYPTEVQEMVQRLQRSLREYKPDWYSAFDPLTSDIIDPLIDPYGGVYSSDPVLARLADMIVHLGGRTIEGLSKWRFCCLLLPKDLELPFYQRRLFVYAQSEHSPHKLLTTVLPHAPSLCLSLRAFQSGHIHCYQEISDRDVTIAHREVEGDIHSAIAVPIGGQNGEPLAVLYVAADTTNAFSVLDQGLLRTVGKIAEEILLTYQMRQQIVIRFSDLVKKPAIVDTSFKDFSSENELLLDVKELLTSIKRTMEERLAKREEDAAKEGPDLEQLGSAHIALIAIDLDNQDDLAHIHGHQAVRNLSRAIGSRIQGQLRARVKDTPLYHLYSDRYCLLFKNMSLQEARVKAERLRNELKGPYRIHSSHTFTEQTLFSGGILDFTNITVRLAVVSCSYDALMQFLDLHKDIAAVRAVVLHLLEDGLKKGQDEGGDVVITWSPEEGMFRRWP